MKLRTFSCLLLVPLFFGLNGYDHWFEPHLTFWESLTGTKERVANPKNIGQVMGVMLREIVENEDERRFLEMPDGPEKLRTHRLGVLGMSAFLKDSMSPGLTLHNGAKLGKVTFLLDFLRQEEDPFGYRLFISRPENPPGQWFEGDILFLRQTPPPTFPSVQLMERLMGRNVRVNFDAMTTLVPYLKSQVA